MPSTVNETQNGNYLVAHAMSSDSVDAGQAFFESSGFGPLVFRTRTRAEMVSDAINAELMDREMMSEESNMERSFSDIVKKVRSGNKK